MCINFNILKNIFNKKCEKLIKFLTIKKGNLGRLTTIGNLDVFALLKG